MPRPCSLFLAIASVALTSLPATAATPVVTWSATTSTFLFSDIPSSLRLSSFDTIAYPRVVNVGPTNLLFAQIGSDNNGGSILYRDIGPNGTRADAPWQLFKPEARYNTASAGSWVYKYTNANPVNINGQILVSYSSRGRGSYTPDINTNGWLNLALLQWNGSTLLPANADGTPAAQTPLNPSLNGVTDPALADKGNPNGDNRIAAVHNWESRLVAPGAPDRLDLYYTDDGVQRITSLDNGLTWFPQQTLDPTRQMATPLLLQNGNTLVTAEVPSAYSGQGKAYYLDSSGTLLSTHPDITPLVSREQAPFVAQVRTGQVLLSTLDSTGPSFLVGDPDGENFVADPNPLLPEAGGALPDWSRPFTNGYWGDIAVLGGNGASNDFIATIGSGDRITLRFGALLPEPTAPAALALTTPLFLRRRSRREFSL